MRHGSRVLAASAAALLWLASAAPAQTSFTEVLPVGSSLFSTNADEDFWINAIAPADMDLDGDLDIAVIGFYVVYKVSVVDRLVIWRNDGAGTGDEWVFTELEVPLGSITAGASDLAWGDYDGDGDPDLAVGSEGAMELYRNDGGSLVATGALVHEYSEDSAYEGSYDLRSLSWADADNDGDPDLLVPSIYDWNLSTFSTKLLRNDGSDGGGGWTFTDSGATIDPTVHAQSAWADDDGDNDLDLFLVNVDPYMGNGFIRRFENNAGQFTGQDLLGITVEHGLADWGDYDADGDMDILVAGNIKEVNNSYDTVLRIYRNDGGSYTENTLTLPSPSWLDVHAATWADYDSDGDVDVLVTGLVNGPGDLEGRSEVYENNGGVFTPIGVNLPAPLSSSGRGGSFTWFDLDGDGDLDYLVAGSYYVPGGNGLVAAELHMFRNGAKSSNQPPAPPQNLRAEPNLDLVTVSWDPSSDDHTPALALTYELQVFLSGTSLPAFRRLPEPGNLSAAMSWELRDLAPGSYEWRVSAVDSAFNGSAPASGAFVVDAGPIGPPGVPDGVDGAAVKVAKLDSSGSTLSIAYDASSCEGAVDHHIVFGTGSQLPAKPGDAFSLSGSVCAIGAAAPFVWADSPDPSADPSGLIWFLVVASDGANTEGSWGTDGRGVERMGPGVDGSSAQCGMTTRSLSNACGH